jgi:hypothetical protein
MSPGLKPDSLVALEVWAEAQTYLRSKGKGNGSEATATAKTHMQLQRQKQIPFGNDRKKATAGPFATVKTTNLCDDRQAHSLLTTHYPCRKSALTGFS